MENSGGGLDIKTGPPCDPAIPLPGVYLEEMESGSQSCWLHVQCRLIHNNRGLATTKPASGSERTKDAELVPQNVAQPRERGGPASAERGQVLHQPRGGRSCISREGGGPAVCTNTGGPEGIVQSEKRQAEKDKYHAISLIVKSKKVQLMETESRRLVSRDWEVEEIGKGVFLKGYRLSVIRGISSANLVFSVGTKAIY